MTDAADDMEPDEDRVPGLLVHFEGPAQPEEADAVMDAIVLLRGVGSVEDVDVRALTVLPEFSKLLEGLHGASQVLWKNSFEPDDAEWLIAECPADLPEAYRNAVMRLTQARTLIDDLLERATKAGKKSG